MPKAIDIRMRQDAHGILRWKANSQVPPKDVLERLGLTPEEMVQHTAYRDADLDKFAEEYRERQAKRTPEEIAEEMAEARATFGPGVELVNIFTDQRIRT